MSDLGLYKFGQGLYSDYAALESKDQGQVYFCTDTKQIFVGADEYTKGTKTLSGEPTVATAGNPGTLYAYNGNLYLCSGQVAGGDYVWTRVANVNDMAGSVVSVAAEDGVETASGSAITSSGTIKHSIPSGATTVTDPTANVSAAFGSTFAIQGVATDKFGHVTASNTRTVTMPTETPVTVTAGTAQSETVSTSFVALAAIGMSTAEGATNHDIKYVEKTYTLPSAVTYSVSSVSEGVITLTGSDASSSTAVINGWDSLAKKSDITTVFRYKGTVATVADLQTVSNPQVGDVYQVTAGSSQGSASEYVCTNATSTPTVWEELGTTIDLSAYATTAYVDQRLTWLTF